MRKLGYMLGVFALGLVAVGAVTGQQQPQKKFGGGGFGFGGFGGGGPLALIYRNDVKKELDITDEQMQKVPDAIQKALGDVLNEKQLTRLRQLDLQQRGPNAFTDAKLQKDLSVTAEQTESIKSILDEAAKERQEIFKEGFGGGGQEKIAALNKETKEKVQGVLTADQRKQYRQMLGEEFKFEQQGFGGFGGNKKFKKKDAE
jgi:hypothetical protein